MGGVGGCGRKWEGREGVGECMRVWGSVRGCRRVLEGLDRRGRV